MFDQLPKLSVLLKYITFCCNRDLKILLYYINILFVAISCKNFVVKD